MTPAARSETDRTIGLAALRLGIEDPIGIAEGLLDVDVEALDEWFNQAASSQVRLFQVADRLTDVGPLLAAGWSNPAPQIAVNNQRDAALASRQVVGVQVDAADLTASILRQTRTLADGELGGVQAALIGTGWPPGTDLFSWAVDNGKLEPVTNIVGGLTGRLTELRNRNEQALSDLASALRADPRDNLQALAAGQPAAAAGVGTAPAGSPPTGKAGQAGQAGQGTGVDQANLDRLATDLLSADQATRAMAQGVQAALLKAAAGGDVAQLLVYEAANSGSQGRAAIGIGDIAEADNVAVMAPGVGNAPVNMAEGMGTAAAIRAAAQQRSPGDETTVVAWYGYDMPLGAVRGVPTNPAATVGNLTAVADDANAQDGGQRLATDLLQFRQWAPDTARFIATGFSMGSTTVSAAAARGAELDDVVLLASPGAGNNVETVEDYQNVASGHVFVGAYDEDPITTRTADVASAVIGNLLHPMPSLPDLSPYGPDPADSDFGAQTMDVHSNQPDVSVNLGAGPFGLLPEAVANEIADLAINHQEGNYLDGETLDAVAAVVTGQYGDVPIKSGR